jgi:histidinol-phosphatase (PHP family)
MTTSYHNHTDWSDGGCTLAEQIAAARALGLEELGISDHFTLTPDGSHVEWSMPLDRLDDYVAELLRARDETRGVALRVGVEADYFPETADDLRALLARHPLDFVVGSVHFVEGFPVDESADLWEALSDNERDGVWRGYWERVRGMAESGVADIVGHLDLPKKFGFRPGVDLSREEAAALDAIAAAGMTVEINTAGWFKPAREAYPSLALLRECRRRDIPLVINADAHEPGHLTRRFEDARALARDAGYAAVCRFAGRKRTSHPL